MSQLKGFKEEPDATLPHSDAERWIAGTYAIWSEYCGGSCKYLGGYEKTQSNAKMIARVLKEDWLVTNHDSGVEMIKYLLENAGPGSDEDEKDFGLDEDFEDDEEYDEDNEDFEDDEEYDEDDEDFEDDEEYDEDDEDIEDDDEFDEDDEDFEDDEELDEDDEDFEDDEEYDEELDEDDEDFDDDEEYDDECEDDEYKADTTAFDYACACNMCGRMFIAGYLTREEAMKYAAEAARKIQERYSSWAEYFQAYIMGAASGSNERDVVPFAAAFQKVVSMPDNPFMLDWNTPL